MDYLVIKEENQFEDLSNFDKKSLCPIESGDLVKESVQLEEDTKIIQLNKNNNKNNKNNKNNQKISRKELKIQLDNANEAINIQKKIISEYQLVLKKLNDDIEEYKIAIKDLNSSLDGKQKIIEEGIKNLRIEKERVAESISSPNKNCNETQLNDKLPMAVDISNNAEKFIHIMESYYMGCQYLENCTTNELALILRTIMMKSYEQCRIKFVNKMEHLLVGSSNLKKLYNAKCLIYSSIGNCIDNTSLETFEKLGPLFNEIHSTDSEMITAKKFVYDCCKFIWTVLLSQPEVRFNHVEYIKSLEFPLYSKDNHNSLGPVKDGMCVKLTIIPSIYLVRDNSLLVKSYVYLESIINKTKEIEKKSNGLSKQHDNGDVKEIQDYNICCKEKGCVSVPQMCPQSAKTYQQLGHSGHPVEVSNSNDHLSQRSSNGINNETSEHPINPNQVYKFAIN